MHQAVRTTTKVIAVAAAVAHGSLESAFLSPFLERTTYDWYQRNAHTHTRLIIVVCSTPVYTCGALHASLFLFSLNSSHFLSLFPFSDCCCIYWWSLENNSDMALPSTQAGRQSAIGNRHRWHLETLFFTSADWNISHLISCRLPTADSLDKIRTAFNLSYCCLSAQCQCTVQSA